MKFYTGIGSRKTPQPILDMFERMGEWAVKKGYCLRSGHADGADSAFERGCDKLTGPKEIYIPWKGFNGSTSHLYLENLNKRPDAFSLASECNPLLYGSKEATRKLHTRNVYQVLGQDIQTPSIFIVCFTPNGEEKGGTATAIRIGKRYNIPIFNAGYYYTNGIFDEAKCVDDFNEFINKIETR